MRDTTVRIFTQSHRQEVFRLFALGGALGVFVLFLNRPVLDHAWKYFDDDINILLNPHLTGGSWDTIKWAWTNFNYARYYLPLGWLMFDGLFGFGGLNAVVFHAASWLLAAVNAVLLFLIVSKFLEPVNSDATRPKHVWRELSAVMAVALFAGHPLRAETVGWASALLYLASQCFASFAILVTLDMRLPHQSR
ncbi:MAG: hypothetical protein EXS42_08295 [Lacunisphaera sp.]|nr:hypothetical protein [Lacunisphaera sp.]